MYMALEDTHLVAEHHQLDVLVELISPAAPDQTEEPAHGEIEE